MNITFNGEDSLMTFFQEPTDATEDGLQVTVVLLLDTASMLKQNHSWQVEKTKESEVFGAWFWLGMINDIFAPKRRGVYNTIIMTISNHHNLTRIILPSDDDDEEEEEDEEEKDDDISRTPMISDNLHFLDQPKLCRVRTTAKGKGKGKEEKKDCLSSGIT